jgi:hypothetical protein
LPRAGFIARTHFTDARASLWLEGALVHLDDLVLHDAGMDIRAPTHELTRAHAVLRTRRRIADGKPDWALSATGLAGLRGRGGRGKSDENTGYRNAEGDEALGIDDDDAGAAEPCEVPPTDDRLADVFAAVDAAIAQTNRTLVANSTSQERRPERDPLIYDPDWHEDARLKQGGERRGARIINEYPVCVPKTYESG